MFKKWGSKRGVNKAPAPVPLVSDFSSKYVLTAHTLGEGSYAKVKLGSSKATNQPVAVKIIDKTKLSANDMKKLYKEVSILKTLSHKNIVRFYDSFEEETSLFIVMEFVTGGELFQKIIAEDEQYTESDVKRIISTMAQALSYCLSKGVVHRDIKPENVLLTPEGDVKLADFNLSFQMDPSQTNFSILQTMCGTPNYVAPEVLSGKPYDFKCDIWSVGVICYLLLSGGYLPFYTDAEGEEGRRKLLQKVKKGKWDFTPVEAWANVTDEAKSFLKSVMNSNPEARADYNTLLQHPWLRLDEDGEDDEVAAKAVIIDTSELARYNAKRKLLLLAKVREAAGIFGDLMNSMGSDGKLNAQMLGLGSADGSGIDAFGGLLGE